MYVVSWPRVLKFSTLRPDNIMMRVVLESCVTFSSLFVKVFDEGQEIMFYILIYIYANDI
jgi:hypothetical protein